MRVKRRWTDEELTKVKESIGNMRFVDLGQIKVPEGVPEEFVGKPLKSAARKQKKERDFTPLFVAWGLPEPHTQFRFAAPRRWRFDYAWPGRSIAVEIEGGLFVNGGAGGRHNRGAGMRDDMEKYNAATLRNWRVFRFMPEQTAEMQLLLAQVFCE